jgi:GNAT superfamily N-acetyltransferase
VIETRLAQGLVPAWWVTFHQERGATLVTPIALEKLLITQVHAAGLSQEAPREVRVWNAYDEDELVGTLVAELHEGEPRSRRSGPYFHSTGAGYAIAASVWVEPEYRGRGAAEALYAQLAALELPVYADFANDFLYARFEARYRAAPLAVSGLEL